MELFKKVGELERIAIQFWIRGKDRNAFHFFAWRIGKDRIPEKMDRLTCMTRPHKPISEAWKAVREQKTVKKWVVF